jgi:hypothetical protein
MQLLQLGINFVQTNLLVSGSDLSADKKKAFYDKLSADEKACYDQIVKDLLHFCAARVDHPLNGLGKNDKRKVYALIFRQSESWNELQKQLDTLSSKGVSLDALDWAAKWKDRICSMKNLQSTIKNQTDELEACQEKLDKLENSAVGDRVFNQTRVSILKSEIDKAKKHIKELLSNGEQEKKENLKDEKLMNNQDCKTIIELLNNNWLSLCVFFDFPKISLDEKKLVVQVNTPNEQIVYDETTLTNPLNSSTKAIFLIEENLEVMPVKYNGVQPGKLIRPTAVKLAKSFFAESSLLTKPPLPPSELTNEIFFGLESVGENKLEKGNITSMAYKLQQIVNYTLQEVNQTISPLNN